MHNSCLQRRGILYTKINNDFKHQNNLKINYLLGIGRVALDTRLGCLSSDLKTNSEPQRIIDGAKYALRNVATLELKAPFWRYIRTPLWTKYVQNMDYFVE